jgi:prophage antirepressor-like protein
MPTKTFCRYIVTHIEGEPCFKGIDVARRLGYTDPYHVLSDHVELVDRITGQFDQKVGRPSTYINESGMYALIFGSKKPEGLSIA